MATNGACERCRFWNQIEGADYGQCRKLPPQPVHFAQTKTEEQLRGESEAVWPTTNDDDWCGAYERSANVDALLDRD